MMPSPPRTRGQGSLSTVTMLLIAVLIAAGGEGGCSSQACTLADCQDGVTATLSTPLSASENFLVSISTPEGEYERTVTPDTRARLCSKLNRTAAGRERPADAPKSLGQRGPFDAARQTLGLNVEARHDELQREQRFTQLVEGPAIESGERRTTI